MDDAVGLLDDREHAQRLAQQRQFLRVDAELAGLGNEGEALDAHDVADVEQLLENGIVHRLVLAGADLIAFDIDLDAAGFVLKLHEGGSAHDAARHDSACDAEVLEVALLRIILVRNLPGGRIDRVKRCGIRLDAQGPDLFQGVPALQFLLAEFDVVHIPEYSLITNPQKYDNSPV